MSEADSVSPAGEHGEQHELKPDTTGGEQPPQPVAMEWRLPGESGPKERRMWWGLLLLLVLVAYVPAIRSQFIWDDNRHITEDKNLRDTAGLVHIWTKFGLVNGGTPQYYPITFTSFWLEYRVFGDQPMGYHLVNVVLHGIGAILVWEILRRLKVPGAWAAAAVWALHPINTESVAWITERKNVLSGVFFFAGILAYLHGAAGFRGQDESTPAGAPASDWTTKLPEAAWVAISFLLYVCALLSKSVAFTMPAVILLLLWWKHRLSAKHWARLIPFIIVGVLMGFLTATVERDSVGATGPEWAFGIADRIIIAGRALWFYAGKIIAPVHLTFMYPRWPIPEPAVSWIAPLAAIAVIAILLALQKKLGRGPATAVLYYAGTLFPALGFVNVYPFRYSFVADHFQYLSGLGLMVLVVAFVAKHLKGRETAKAAPVLAGVLCALLTAGTWVRASAFYDEITLWRDTLAKNDSSWMAHHNLGAALQKEAIELGRLGDAEGAKKDLDEAEAQFRRALAINPKHEWAHFNLGQLYMIQSRLDDALTEFKASLENTPYPSRSYGYIGLVLAQQGKYKQAEQYLKQAIDTENQVKQTRIIPEKSVVFRVGLAKVYEQEKRDPEAMALYREALQIHPDNEEARRRLGMLLAAANKPAEALDVLAPLLQTPAGSDPDLIAKMGYLLGMTGNPGDLRKSYEFFRSALQIDPSNKLALQGMAELLASTRPSTTQSSTQPATTQASTRPATGALATVPPAATTRPATTAPVNR